MGAWQHKLAVVIVGAALLAACGGGGGSSGSTPPAAQSGTLSVLLSDASSEDWAQIGVKILSISLVPQGGGANVPVYDADPAMPALDLTDLDDVGELLGNASVPAGTYSGAVVTVGANPGDVPLTVGADPQPGFAGPAGASIPSNQIQVQNAQGGAPNKTAAAQVKFSSPLTIAANRNNQMVLELDLGDPAFIVDHAPADGGATIWSVDFDGPLSRREVSDVRNVVLRQMYGVVTSVAADYRSLTIDKEYPAMPPVDPETAVSTGRSLTILADAQNGTTLYDVDAKAQIVIKDFSSASLTGKQLRIAARYQPDGSLVAVRIWASAQFNDVWCSPEGHVLHVDTANGTITIQEGSGQGVPVKVDANTQFYFRDPQNPAADATPIGAGPAFLEGHNLVRGFKVHVGLADPHGNPWVAQSIDIEAAVYGGRITSADSGSFTYVHDFRSATDGYTYTLPYLSANTPNGSDSQGNAIAGYKWWDFADPEEIHSGAGAIGDFVATTGGSVDLGGTVGAIGARGSSYAVWNDPANSTGWSASATVLRPSQLPLGVVANGLANGSFTMTVAGGAAAATVDVATAPGQATLAYRIDRTSGAVRVTPVDLATGSGLAALTDALTPGTKVRVYGIPRSDGTLAAYVVDYFTGTQPGR